MEHSQKEFVLEQLQSLLSEKSDYMEDKTYQALSVSETQLGLSHTEGTWTNCMNGKHMKRLLHLCLNSLVKNDTKECTYHLNEENNKIWLSRRKCLHLSKPDLYTITLFGQKESILAKDYDSDKYSQAMREYLIGLQIINPLRSRTPCFVYTLGSFSYGTSKVAILYEKVTGISLDIMLQEGLSFNRWLHIFFQLMLSLEIAQRESRFTHFDLHAGNVMIKEVDDQNYHILLDNLVYNIRNPKLLPVIIDFGTSTSSLNGRSIGSYDYTNSGIYHFMVAGHDIYKLMVSSYCNARNSSTRRGILKLFNFFKGDPYRVADNRRSKGITEARDDFCKQISFSQVANHTPMMMIKYLYSKHHQKLSSMVTLAPRKEYVSLHGLTTTDDYSKALYSASVLINKCTGYLVPTYLLNLASKTEIPSMKNAIQDLRVKLNMNRKKCIESDLSMLENVFDIEIPTQESLEKARDAILDIPIRYRNASIKEKVFDELVEVLHYQDRLRPYLQFYFSILELGLEKTYKVWITNFQQSELYKFNSSNRISNDRSYRWGETLLASIFSGY